MEAGGAEGAVISIRGSTESVERDLTVALARATRGESARLLRLSFDDIGMERYGDFLGPTMAQSRTRSSTAGTLSTAAGSLMARAPNRPSP